MPQNNRPVSIWEMLKEYTCVIPIIQRDYAQGRRGKELLRKRFFRQLVEAIVSKKNITLDFVYGTPAAHNYKVIYPLDGQQRLTSLWLLYWYVAFRAGKLKYSEVCDTLKKFTYQTRASSRDFCSRVCQELIGKNNSAAKLITEQPWFSRRFKMDPTVRAMLRSLSDEEHGSGFEQMLGNRTDFAEIWECLIAPDCPIKFYFRSTKEENIANSDDLYIKMNARGKKLTDFENFKSELFSFKDDEGKELFRDGSNFIKNFENELTNLFWTLRHEEKNIVDHIQFEFFNRMILAHILVNGDVKSADKELYEHISGHENFSSIKVYHNALTRKFRDFFASVMDGIIKLKKSGEEINEHLFDEPYPFSYLPIYESSQSKSKAFQTGNTNESFWVTDITVADIVRFYAASLFFHQIDKSKDSFDESAFKDWMFFSRNLFENSGIDEFAETKRILELFRAIGDNCLRIIEYLCSEEAGGLSVSGDLLQSQYEEEREKARKIQESRIRNEESEYEKFIREAEIKYPFSGAIRFLFTNESGETDWSSFKIKKKNFDKILKLDHEDKRLSPLALRTLLGYVESWEVLTEIWDISSSYDSWKKILINKQSYIRPVHLMLLNGVNEERLENFKSPITDPIQKATHEELVKSKFLHQTTWASFTFRAEDHMAMVWNSSAPYKRYLLGTPRNRLIAEGIKEEEISVDCILEDHEHLWGENFYFELKKNPSDRFRFWWNGTKFRRIKEGGKDIYICTKADDKYFPDAEKCEEFAISVDYSLRYEDFINDLTKLLNKAENYQPSGSGE